jgi:hypothetical protein
MEKFFQEELLEILILKEVEFLTMLSEELLLINLENL